VRFAPTCGGDDAATSGRRGRSMVPDCRRAHRPMATAAALARTACRTRAPAPP